MARWLGLLIFSFFITFHTYAIEAVVAHTTFYLPDTAKQGFKPYIELVWQINPRSLHYVRSVKNTLSSIITTDIIFRTDTGIMREDRYDMQTPPKENEKDVLAMNMLRLHRYGLPAGKITLQFSLTDITDTTNRFVYTDTFTIMPPGSAFYSGIQLLDTVYPATGNNIFQKNNEEQIPMSTNFLGDDKRFLKYYFELYNSSLIPTDEYPLIQHTFISQRENDAALMRFSKYDTIKPNTVLPCQGSFKITTLTSGNYYINVTLVNRLHRQIAVSSQFYQRYNKSPEKLPDDTAQNKPALNVENVTVLDLNKTFIGKYNFAQVRSILKMLIPVTDQTGYQTIKGFLKKPDELYMRYFIYNYFAGINKKDPTAAWLDYIVKVKEVKKLFDAAGTPGYETDRGLIYMRYGKPTQRIKVDNEVGTNPYEVWMYDKLVQTGSQATVGNGTFLFYKPEGSLSDYTLLHSTVPGEIRNPKWRDLLYTSTENKNSYSSQAEQYIGNK